MMLRFHFTKKIIIDGAVCQDKESMLGLAS